MKALVLVMPYAKEVNTSSIVEVQDHQDTFDKHPPQLDVEILLYIARSNMIPQKKNPSKKKGCYNCEAKDHWQKECPFEKQSHLIL